MIPKKAIAWGMYDLANTIYSALFVTFFFPFYIKNYLGGTEFMVGAVFSSSMLLVGLFVPALGAVSDIVKRRMPFIVFFTSVNCAAVALVPSFGLAGALILALIANFTYHAALNIYNALLPDVCEGEGIGRISGIGVGMGYMGTFISLGVAYMVMAWIGWGSAESVKAMFYITSILFFGISLFTFFGVPERAKSKKNMDYTVAMRKGISQAIKGVKTAWACKPLRSFFATIFWFTNAMNAVIIFLFLFSQETLDLTVQSFFPAYAFFAFGAAAGAIILSKLIDSRGPRSMLRLAGWTWIAVIAVLLAINTIDIGNTLKYQLFIFSGTIGGAALGLVWASSRPLLIELAPKGQLGEYFGFMELTSKFSGVLGPALFGFLATYSGYGWAISSLFLFFLIGLWTLRRIPEQSAPKINH